jgi:hypothetical protein
MPPRKRKRGGDTVTPGGPADVNARSRPPGGDPNTHIDSKHSTGAAVSALSALADAAAAGSAAGDGAAAASAPSSDSERRKRRRTAPPPSSALVNDAAVDSDDEQSQIDELIDLTRHLFVTSPVAAPPRAAAGAGAISAGAAAGAGGAASGGVRTSASSPPAAARASSSAAAAAAASFYGDSLGDAARYEAETKASHARFAAAGKAREEKKAKRKEREVRPATLYRSASAPHAPSSSRVDPQSPPPSRPSLRLHLHRPS